MLFFGISLIMKEKSNASALAPSCVRIWEQLRPCLGADALVSPPRCAEKNRKCGAQTASPSLGLPLCSMQRPHFPRQFLPRFRLSIKIKAKKNRENIWPFNIKALTLHSLNSNNGLIRQLSWQSTTLLMLGSWVRTPSESQRGGFSTSSFLCALKSRLQEENEQVLFGVSPKTRLQFY